MVLYRYLATEYFGFHEQKVVHPNPVVAYLKPNRITNAHYFYFVKNIKNFVQKKNTISISIYYSNPNKLTHFSENKTNFASYVLFYELNCCEVDRNMKKRQSQKIELTTIIRINDIV